MSRKYQVRTERERVLEAMVRTAAARGYEQATVEEVAAAAGVSRDAFEEMFSSKEECFLAAHEAMTDVLYVRFSEAYRKAGEPWAARVVAGLQAVLELLASEPEVVRMGMLEVSSAGEEARVRYRLSLDRFVPLLEEGRVAVASGEDLPAETARLAIGVAVSMIFDEVRAGRGGELPQILPKLSLAMLMPYLGVEEAETAIERLT